MRFLADMGISQRVCQWLRESGHDIVHLRDEGLQRLPNGRIFHKAIKEDRIVLTFDLDFGEIAAATSGQLTSVLIFRLKNARAENVIARLRHVLGESASDLSRGAIVTVEEARHRVRRLPLG